MTDLKLRSTEPGKAFVTFKPRADGGIILEVSGADVWSGKDGAEFALWLRDTVASITAIEAQLAAADLLAGDLHGIATEISWNKRLRPVSVAINTAIAAYRAIRGGV